MFGRRCLWLAVAVCSLCACSLLVDTDGLADLTPLAPDASFDASVARFDGSARDGAVTFADPCGAANVIACETFDDADPMKKFGGELDPTTSRSLDTTRFASAPRSGLFVIRPDASNSSPDSTLVLRYELKPARFAVEASFYVEEREVGIPGRLIRVSTETAGNLFVESSGAIKTGTEKVGQLPPVESGVWHAIRFELVLDASPPTARVSLDGQTSGDLTIGGWTPNVVVVAIGISEASSPATGWRVYWDDIVVSKLP